MANYKAHIAFALLLTFPLFPDVFPLALAVIGASIPDFDLRVKQDKIMLFFVMGLITTVLFYFFNLPYLLGVTLMTLSFIFYLAKHRSFTHSLVGIICLAVLLTVLTIALYWLFFFSIDLSQEWTLSAIIVILGILCVKHDLIAYYVLISILGILLTPFPGLNLYNILFPILIGLLSHVTLDLLSPSGVKLLIPFYKKPLKRPFAGLFVSVWMIITFFVIKFYGFNMFGLWSIL